MSNSLTRVRYYDDVVGVIAYFTTPKSNEDKVDSCAAVYLRDSQVSDHLPSG